MLIDQLPKGALPDLPDDRDYKLVDSPMGASQIPWAKGSGLPRPPLRDQGSSDSCVAHAWSYYHWQVNNNNFSRRDLFARIALDYGAFIRDGGVQIVKAGQATIDEVSDPSPQTMQNMRDKTGITLDKEASDREMDSFSVPGSIDMIAGYILAYKGVVLGVNGTNPGWQNLTVPRPPKAGEEVWGHGLYAVDFHIHDDGQKCIICATSWPSAGIIEHHLREEYFTSGNVFNPWTLIPRERETMILKENNGGYVIEGPLGHLGINKPEFLNALLKIVKPEDIKHGAPTGPQLGVIETAPESFVIKPN